MSWKIDGPVMAIRLEMFLFIFKLRTDLSLCGASKNGNIFINQLTR